MEGCSSAICIISVEIMYIHCRCDVRTAYIHVQGLRHVLVIITS